MIIMKFGGTSVENGAMMKQVKEIVRAEVHRTPVVVLSAISGATNQLIQCAQYAVEGKLDKANEILNRLSDRHHEIVGDICTSSEIAEQLRSHINAVIDELVALSKSLSVFGDLSARSLDTFAAAGERMSSKILALYLNESGIPAELVDARLFMVTNEHYTKALPLHDAIRRLTPERILPFTEKGKIVVTQGFIGVTMSGITTTLGRGGSDYSAAIIGAALDAEEIQIWTDVDGVMTADPRIVPTAMKLDIMSFQEASELAFFGAKVLHPSTIQPAVEKSIPVIVLNAKRPSSTGTRIVGEAPRTNAPVKAIACKKGITIVSIQSSRMLMAYGFLESIFNIFNRYKTSVDVVSTSEVSVSLTVDDEEYLDYIIQELKNFAEVTIYRNKGIICIIGEQMRSTAGVSCRVFHALRNINIILISQGASEINMSIVIDEEHIDKAVRCLHDEFFAGIKEQGGNA